MTFTKCTRAKDRRGVDLISDALPFGRLWYDGPKAAGNAIGYARQHSRSHGAVIRVYDELGRDRDAGARGRFQRGVMFPRKAQKKPRTCKHLLGRFNAVKKFRAFTASFLRRVFGSADHSGADQTSDRAGAAQR